MVLRLKPQCLDQWSGDFEIFNYDFRLYVLQFAKAVGYSFEVDVEALRAAHSLWVANCRTWQENMVAPGSNGLSHIKMMALLLYQLATNEWMKALSEFEGEERDGLQFGGSDEEREELRKDINGGGSTYLGFQFAMMVLNYFESGRIDRLGPFLFRLTPSLEHDILVYLHSPGLDEMGLFLVFEALYVRPKKIISDQALIA